MSGELQSVWKCGQTLSQGWIRDFSRDCNKHISKHHHSYGLDEVLNKVFENILT